MAGNARRSPPAACASPISTPRSRRGSIGSRRWPRPRRRWRRRAIFSPTSRRESQGAARARQSRSRSPNLTRRLRRWRFGAVAASALAAALAIGVGLRETTRVSTPRQFVAVLQKSADAPAFVITINLDTRDLTVRPVAAPPQTGKAYELWIIDDKLGAPRSLGVIDPRNLTANPGAQSLRSGDRARRDLRCHHRAAGRIADRRALGTSGLRRQAVSDRAVTARRRIRVRAAPRRTGA